MWCAAAAISTIINRAQIDESQHCKERGACAWGVLAMKMVCTAGLLVGTTAGPEATPGGTVMLKSAGNGLGALAGASCSEACPSFRQCRVTQREGDRARCKRKCTDPTAAQCD